MSNQFYDIREIEECDIEDIVDFTDQWIGKGYFSARELQELIELSEGSSFIAVSKTSPRELLGVRLSIAAGKLQYLGLKDLSLSLWPVPIEEMGYFKSLFIKESAWGQGIGRALSSASIEALKLRGAKAIACHSWLESPQDSSRKYLHKMGFQQVRQHEKFWYDVDYECTRCGDSRCICTAVEMVKVL